MGEISFQGENWFLSNFYPRPVTFGGVKYLSAEHAFQAQKSFDPEYQASVLYAQTPGKAKRLGKHVTLRPDWEMVKLDIMRGDLQAKFEVAFRAK